MAQTIQQRVYALIPVDQAGIDLCSLRRSLLMYPDSVNNAVTRLKQLGLIEVIAGRPGCYRRVDGRDCPEDRRGWPRGRRR